MEAKDTVMNFMRIEEIDAKNATSNFTDALVDVAKEQAEISFNAGRLQGRIEVLRQIHAEMIHQPATMDSDAIHYLRHNSYYKFFPFINSFL